MSENPITQHKTQHKTWRQEQREREKLRKRGFAPSINSNRFRDSRGTLYERRDTGQIVRVSAKNGGAKDKVFE
jgi:hypothetical protein